MLPRGLLTVWSPANSLSSIFTFHSRKQVYIIALSSALCQQLRLCYNYGFIWDICRRSAREWNEKRTEAELETRVNEKRHSWGWHGIKETFSQEEGKCVRGWCGWGRTVPSDTHCDAFVLFLLAECDFCFYFSRQIQFFFSPENMILLMHKWINLLLWSVLLKKM